MDPDWVDVFPIENRDIPASYVRLPEGKWVSFRIPFSFLSVCPQNLHQKLSNNQNLITETFSI